MAVIHDVQPVKPVCAVTFAPEINLDDVIKRLVPLLGRIDAQSSIYAFNFTDYYGPEMGTGLSKLFVGFEPLMHPAALAALKRATNGLEKEWLSDGNRMVNIDPAYLALPKLVVASAKDFAHRIYIGEGIYGDLQLQYKHGRFHSFPWTFPDYQTETALGFFEHIRDQLSDRLRHEID